MSLFKAEDAISRYSGIHGAYKLSCNLGFCPTPEALRKILEKVSLTATGEGANFTL